MDADLFWPALYISLPTVERDGRRVVRQVGIHEMREHACFSVEYMERTQHKGSFRSVLWSVVDTLEDAMTWGASCGQ